MLPLRLALLFALCLTLPLAGCDTRTGLERTNPPPSTPGTGGGSGGDNGEEEPPQDNAIPEQEPNGGGFAGGLQPIERPSPLVIAGSVQSDDAGSSLLGRADDFEDFFAVSASSGPTATLSGYTGDLHLAIVGPIQGGGEFGGADFSNGSGQTETVSLSSLGEGVYLIGVSYYDADGSEGESDYRLEVRW